MTRYLRNVVLMFNIVLLFLALSNVNAQVSLKSYQDTSSDSLESSVDVSTSGLRRFDFKWAEQYHAIVDAIESRDEAAFNRFIESLRKGSVADSVSAAIGRDLLREFLGDCFSSRSDGLNRLFTTWSQQTDLAWDSDILFALNDLLDRLFNGNDLKKLSLQKSIRVDLKRRLAKLEDAFNRSVISKSELSRFAFRHIRRLPDDEDTVRECDRLLQSLQDDFGLTSILIERLNSLYKRAKDQWRERYQQNLLAAKKLLTKDQPLRLQFPLAMPKVLTELSRLQPDDASRLIELQNVLAACAEARTLLAQDEKLSSRQQLSNLNILHEFRASALWDGYKLQKALATVDSNPPREGIADLFAPFIVANSLQELADIHKDNNRMIQRFLGAQLRQASVLLDLLTSSSSSPKNNTELVENEQRFLQILEGELKPRLATNTDRNSPLASEAYTSTDLELVWIEWRMKNRVSWNRKLDEITECPTAVQPIDRKNLLDRLNQLRNRIHTDAKDRVLTAIGYLHLTYGEYQLAIDALAEIKQIEQFAGQVIRCLAYKDSGNFDEAMDALEQIKGFQSGPNEELIKLFLESDLALAQGQAAKSINDLHEKLNDSSLLKGTLEETLHLNNEHHQALSLLNPDSGSQPSREQRQKAYHIWKKHLEFNGDNRSFIRARAAYSLATAQISNGSDLLAKEVSKREKLKGKYEADLKEYTDLAVKTRETHARLAKLYETIRTLDQEIIEERQRFFAVSNREYLTIAMTEVENLRDESHEYRYPNLVYNILCLAMRVHLVAPQATDDSDAYSKKLKDISVNARTLALQQRNKLSKEGVFDENRNALFERYRDAFDLTVELVDRGAVGDLVIADLAFIGADTTNQTFVDLFKVAPEGNLLSDSTDPLAGRRFISFFVGADATHVFWRIDDDTVYHHRAKIERADIVRVVQDYVGEYLSKDPLEGLSDRAFKRARELQEKLFHDELKRQLSNAAKSNRCVYVIPHGPLFQIPLDTLPTGDSPASGEFLIDQCPPLIYLPTLSSRAVAQVVPGIRRRALLTVQPDPTIGGESKLLLGQFHASETLRITPDRLAETSQLRDDYRNQSFDVAKLLHELTLGYRIVHFGSHGGFQAAWSDNSNLASKPIAEPVPGIGAVVTEVEDRVIKSKGEVSPYLSGAYLQLWELGEVSDLPHVMRKPNIRTGKDEVFEVLRASAILNQFKPWNGSGLNSELLLLSACETQVVDSDAVRYGGNTIKAMGTSFLVAGAENVIAAHWRVDDKSTTSLVTEFMGDVSTRFRTKLSAVDFASILHEQRKLLRGKFKDPYHWGAFTLSTILTHNEQK